MLESRRSLPVGVWDFALVLPFAEQEGLAAREGGQPDHVLPMAVFHDQHQVGRLQYLRGQLAGPMVMGVLGVSLQSGQGVLFERAADQGGEPGGAHLDTGAGQPLPEQMLAGGAAADIARADNQDSFEHAEYRRIDSLSPRAADVRPRA